MNRSYLLLCLVSLACGWDFYSILPSIYYRTVSINQGLGNATDIDDVELTDSTSALYGWGVATFPIAAFIFSGVFGGLTPALGPRNAICLGLIVMIAGNIIYMIDKPEIVYVMAGRGVAGCGSGVRVACLAVVSSWYSGKMRGEKIGTWYMFQLVAMTIGPSVAAGMSKSSFWDITSFALPAFVSAILELITLVLILIFGLDPPEEAAEMLAQLQAAQNAQEDEDGDEPIASAGTDIQQEAPPRVTPRRPNSARGQQSTSIIQESDFDGLTQPLAVSSHYFHPDDDENATPRGSPRPSSARLAINPPKEDEGLVDKKAQNSSKSYHSNGGGTDTAAAPTEVSNLHGEEEEPPKKKWPPGLTVMLIANFVMICAVTTFEAMLTPLLHQRFSGSRLLANLTFAGIGVCVVIASVGAGVAQRCGAKPYPVMLLGVALFLIGMILSLDYGDISDDGAMALETIAILLCSVGFTIAYVKTTEVYAGLIVANGMLPKMGGLMAILSMLGSFGRVIGPLTTGYGLMVDANLIIYLMIGIIFFTFVLIACTKKMLELPF